MVSLMTLSAAEQGTVQNNRIIAAKTFVTTRMLFFMFILFRQVLF
jgi:hypothetical protein